MPWVKPSIATTKAGRSWRSRPRAVVKVLASMQVKSTMARTKTRLVTDPSSPLSRSPRKPTTPPRSSEESIAVPCSGATPSEASQSLRELVSSAARSAYCGTSPAKRATESTRSATKTTTPSVTTVMAASDPTHPGRPRADEVGADRRRRDRQDEREEGRRDDPRDAVQADRDDHRRGETDDDEHAARQGGAGRSRGSHVRAHRSSTGDAGRRRPPTSGPASQSACIPPSPAQGEGGEAPRP